MPVLEDGLSSGHASDTDNNNPTVMLMKRQITEIEREINQGMCKPKQGNKQENGLSPNKDCVNQSPNDLNGCVNNFEETHILPQMDPLGIIFFKHRARCNLPLYLNISSIVTANLEEHSIYGNNVKNIY